MPASSTPEIQRAWAALWNSKSPFYLPTALKKKTRVGFSWFRPVDDVEVPTTGPIVVLNSTAFGIVTINLQNGTVSDLWKVTPGPFEADEATGKVTAELKFSALKFAGDYEVRRGRATGDALKVASRSLKSHPLFAAVDPDPNLSLARSYQKPLSQTANGQTMLNNYYTHNDAYSSAFGNQSFNYHWANDTTGGNNTQDWSNLTANAAQPGNVSTVIVNSSNGTTYDQNYSLHSYHMQNLLTVACNAQQNFDAGTAAGTFQVATTTPSGSPQTVNNVLGIVATGTPPSATDVANFVAPDWMAAIHERNKPIHEAIQREEEAVRRGVIIREETVRPIHSGFVSYVAAPSLKLSGTVTQAANGSASVQFDSLEGSVQNVDLALGVFPGTLYPELSAAVDKASFLKSVLSRQVTNSIAASPLLNHVGRLLSLALAKDTAPIG